MVKNLVIDETRLNDRNDPAVVPVGISNRHVHLSEQHIEKLFGPGFELTPIKDLSQPGQFAAKELLQVVGPKGILENVRILGPARKESQVELSQTEARNIGIKALVRDSGDLDGTNGCVLIGPKGYVILEKGVICAKTHLHLHTSEAQKLGIKDKQTVNIYLKGEGKSGCIFDVLARVGDNYALDLHVDTDESNAFRLGKDAVALIIDK